MNLTKTPDPERQQNDEPLIGIGIAIVCFGLGVTWGAIEHLWRRLTRTMKNTFGKAPR